MKTLLIFPQTDKRTGLYILKAFTNLGHEVTVCDPKVESIGSCESLARKLKPDLTFCSRTPALSAIAKELKRNSGKLAMWNVDVRDDVKHWANLFPLMQRCDRFFTVGGADAYRKAGFENVEWLPQGIDPDTHKPIDLEYEVEQYRKYECDIMFVGSYGNLWEGRKEFLDKLYKDLKYKIKIFGDNSPMGLPFLDDTKANVAYNCAAINVGYSGWPNVKGYTSVRDYKILATGQPLVVPMTNNGNGIPKELTVLYFKGFKGFMDCVEELRYKDRKMMPSGFEDNVDEMIENHTYTHRIKRALELLYGKNN